MKRKRCVDGVYAVFRHRRQRTVYATAVFDRFQLQCVVKLILKTLIFYTNFTLAIFDTQQKQLDDQATTAHTTACRTVISILTCMQCTCTLYM